MSEYKLCTHTYDSGRTCKSAAARGRDFCGYHLHYRGRLMRMARQRSRNELFNITLPPLDSLCSIQSALSQVAEALAADMIDPRRAQGLLKALRFAKENLRDSLKDNVDWHDSPYLSEDQSPYDNFESDYGLPENLDLSVRPEVAFPPPPDLQSVILSERSESKDLFVAPQASGDTAPSIPGQPDVSNLDFRPDHPVSAEMLENNDVYYNVSPEAATVRIKQLDRNRHRRELRNQRKGFADQALRHNIRIAAEKLARQQLAAAGVPDPQAQKKAVSAADLDTQFAEADAKIHGLSPTGSNG